MSNARANADTDAAANADADERAWIRILKDYREPSRFRSIVELTITVVPFVVLWALAWAAVDSGHWWGLVATVPAAGFLLRLFVIQHDCGHGSFFPTRRANDWLGRTLGVLTLTPYGYWRRTHAAHHANSGNLDERGMGDVDTLTVAEYLALPRWRRLGYRLYRHPVVMFGLAAPFMFFLQHRVPVGLMRAGRQPWVSTMGTNLAIAVAAAAAIWAVGLVPFLLVHVPIVMMAATAGVWLFFVQHQFEDTYWARDPQWQFHRAGLHGSSHYDLPPGLRWLTGHIGVHHVHHLSSRVPFYRLPAVLRDHPELRGVSRLTLVDSLRCARLVLWDEDRRQLVTFRDVRGRARQPRPQPGALAALARQTASVVQAIPLLPVRLYHTLAPARSRR
jgi:acyl-lipid omega-6 desaturase (Delta-12 desaturase)